MGALQSRRIVVLVLDDRVRLDGVGVRDDRDVAVWGAAHLNDVHRRPYLTVHRRNCDAEFRQHLGLPLDCGAAVAPHCGNTNGS